MREAVRRWSDGNDAGRGYPWVPEGTPFLHAAHDREVEVYAMPDGREVATAIDHGDDARGVWAVARERAREYHGPVKRPIVSPRRS